MKKKTSSKSKKSKELGSTSQCIITIKNMGKIYTGKGSTMKEAIENITPITKVIGGTVIIASNGDKSITKVMNGNLLMRIFSPSRLMRELAIKNMSYLFNI